MQAATQANPFGDGTERSAARARDAGVVYKINSFRQSFAELSRCGSRWQFPLFALFKVLRVRLPGSAADPNVERLLPFLTDAASIDPAVLTLLQSGIQQLPSDRFDVEEPLYFEIVDGFNSCVITFALCFSLDGRTVGRVLVGIDGSAIEPKRNLSCDYITGCTGDRFLVTTSAKAYGSTPATVTLEPRVGLSPDALWAFHERRLSGRTDILGAQRDGPVGLAERHHAVMRDYLLERRVFAEMSAAESDAAEAMTKARRDYAPGGAFVADTMVEVTRRLQRRGGLSESILLLFFSLLGFIGSARSGWNVSWKTMVWLIPILFFHELGHFLAMRLFGYRNVRMFFIPYLGAAVSGQNYGIETWKRVVVSLAGPVPGIVVGGVLGMAGLVLHSSSMMQGALLAVTLNGVNLLPILPLDGGRVAQLLIFSRHPLLNVGFRGLAVLFILLSGLVGTGSVRIGIAVALLMNLPLAYRLATAAAALRRSGIPLSDESGHLIPIELAPALVEAARDAAPKLKTRRNLSLQVLQLFDDIQEQAPGALATVSLGFLQAGAMAAAFICASLFYVSRGGTRGGLIDTPSDPFNRAVSVATIDTVGTIHDTAPMLLPERPVMRRPLRRDPAETGLAPRTVVVANFKDAETAKAAFGDARGKLRDNEVATLFGESLLISVPGSDDDARKRWWTFADGLTREAFVVTEGSTVSLDVQCELKSIEAGVNIDGEVRPYLALARTLPLVPPWMPVPEAGGDAETPAQGRARRTLLKVQQAGYDSGLGSMLTTMQASRDNADAMRKAMRSGDKAEIQKLQEAQHKALREKRQKALEELSRDPDVDKEIVDLYTQEIDGKAADSEAAQAAAMAAAFLPGMDAFSTMNNAAGRERLVDAFGPRVGLLPRSGDQVVPGESRYSVSFGLQKRGDDAMSFNALQFDDLVRGPPAFIRWIEAQGCAPITYELRGGGYVPDE